MPESPLANRFQNDHDGPAGLLVDQSQSVNVNGWKSANPWRAIDALAVRRLFDVATLQPDRDETLWVVVQVAGPVIADKVMQVDRPLARKPRQLPSVKVSRASLAAVDLFKPHPTTCGAVGLTTTTENPI